MNKNWLWGAVFMCIIVGISYVFGFKNHNTPSVINVEKTQNEKNYEYLKPEPLISSSYFRGQFLTNTTAGVYPRREAIVSDILHDIGDKIKKGDTLAYLLNPGVLGEGESRIVSKISVLQSKKDVLSELENVKIAKINEIDQKIKENQNILVSMVSNFDHKILEISGSENINSELSIKNQELEVLKGNLSSAIETKKSEITKLETDIEQKTKLLDNTISDVESKIMPIVYLGKEEYISYSDFSFSDISELFGSKNEALRLDSISALTDYFLSRQKFDTYQRYDNLILLNNKILQALLNTPVTSEETPESKISSYISKINLFNDSLIKSMESLDSAINTLNSKVSAHDEKINNIELLISKKENEIGLLSSKVKTIESDKSLSSQRIESEIENLKKQKEYIIANENKSITTLKSEIKVIESELNAESIKSGDYKIVSPFSGIITQRNIEVGQKVSPSIEAFRMSNIKSALSEINKSEIEFYVPEKYANLIKDGDSVTFSSSFSSELLEGEIYRISSEIDKNTLSIVVRAKVSSDIDFLNNSSVRVFLDKKENTHKIPVSVIYNRNGERIVYFKKDNGKFGPLPISIISESGEFAIVKGLTDDIEIVATPLYFK